jgi:hypothetical protein
MQVHAGGREVEMTNIYVSEGSSRISWSKIVRYTMICLDI